MEVLTPKTTRRCTRLRVEIPVSVISLDRARPFGDRCVVLIVSPQGCGFRSSEAIELETPIMMSGLPGGGSVTARVASCVPLGSDGKYFLVGASLYTHGNVWGIPNPPEDWKDAEPNASAAASSAHAASASAADSAAQVSANKKSWPYNLFDHGAETHPGRK